MSIPQDFDGLRKAIAPSDQTSDTVFDPAACFGQWFEAVEDFRNRELSGPSPGFYLENGDWTVEEESGFNEYFAETFRSEGSLVVATHGKLRGNIEVHSAVIDGMFSGKITAAECVVLENHALVIGEIYTPSLTIRGGAIIEGTCHFENPRPERSGPLGWELFKEGLSRVWRSRVS